MGDEAMRGPRTTPRTPASRGRTSRHHHRPRQPGATSPDHPQEELQHMETHRRRPRRPRRHRPRHRHRHPGRHGRRAIGRNPDAASQIRGLAIILAAFAEGLGVLAVVVGLLAIFLGAAEPAGPTREISRGPARRRRRRRRHALTFAAETGGETRGLSRSTCSGSSSPPLNFLVFFAHRLPDRAQARGPACCTSAASASSRASRTRTRRAATGRRPRDQRQAVLAEARREANEIVGARPAARRRDPRAGRRGDPGGDRAAARAGRRGHRRRAPAGPRPTSAPRSPTWRSWPPARSSARR